MKKFLYSPVVKNAVCMILMGSIGIFRQHIPLSSGMLALVRGFVGGTFIVLYMFLQRKKNPEIFQLTKNELGSGIVVGIAVGFNWVLLFEAFRYTSVMITTLVYYMEPTIVILISPLFFKEKLTWKKMICVVVAVVGISLVSGLGQTEEARPNMTGIVLSLSAALAYVMVVLLAKRSPTIHVYSKTAVQLYAAGLTMVPYLLFTREITHAPIDLRAIFFVIVVGVLDTGIADLFYYSSLPSLKAQTVALLSYLEPISAVFLSALFLKEKMTWLMFLGAVMVIGASIISEIEREPRKVQMISDKERQRSAKNQ